MKQKGKGRDRTAADREMGRREREAEKKQKEMEKPIYSIRSLGDFPGGLVVKNPPGNAGNTGLIPGGGTKTHVPWSI